MGKIAGNIFKGNIVMIIKNILRNMSYSVASNGFSLLISVLIIFILPKFVSSEVYGEWQLFLFFCSYLGFFHFGWEDGIYLRYAGYDYSRLPFYKISGQIWGILLLQVILSAALIIGGLSILKNIYSQYILFILAIALMVFINLGTFFSFYCKLQIG